MEKLLTPGDSTSLLYRSVDGKKFDCADYSKLGRFLTRSLFESTRSHDLHVDWTSCRTHPLIFDIDVENSDDTFDVLTRYFDSVFLKSFERRMPLADFALLSSMRKGFSGGMHVRVLNVEMAHDDYVHLCNLMRTEYEENGVRVKLDCPASMSLVACDKYTSKKDFYVPVNIVRRYFCDEEKTWKTRKVAVDDFEIASCMMPVPEENATYLKYPTRITRLESNCIAKFKSCVNDRDYAVVKENRLVEGDGSLCRRFLEQNAKFINPFVSFEYKILKTWYKRYSFKNVSDTGIFRCIDDRLRNACVHLKDEDSPLNALLQTRYFLPVFYSLCNLKRREPEEIEREIHKHFSISRETFYRRECTRLDFDTILYCAFNTVPPKTKEGSYLKFMGMGWDWIFECTRSVEDLKSHLRFVQKRYYPIVKRFENGKLYSWDPCLNVWSGVCENGMVALIKKIYDGMKYFEGYSKMSEEIRLNDDLIRSLRDDIVEELETVEGAAGDEDLKKYYGQNVPQYYFFDYGLDGNDTC